MEIEIFTLCDAAADYQGRLNILGVFDTIFAPKLPAIHPFCSVALRVRFQATEHGQHSLIMHIADYDGNLVIPEIRGSLDVKMPDRSKVACVNLVLNLGQLKLSKYGEYAINLAIDGDQKVSLPFWVKEPPRVEG